MGTNVFREQIPYPIFFFMAAAILIYLKLKTLCKAPKFPIWGNKKKSIKQEATTFFKYLQRILKRHTKVVMRALQRNNKTTCTLRYDRWKIR